MPVAVVTGGAQGFGLGIARGLTDRGWKVGLLDVNEDGASRAASELGGFGCGCDVRDLVSVENAYAKAAEALGPLDLVVANAGVVRAGGVTEIDPDDFRFVTDVNYHGFFNCVRAAVPHLADRETWTDVVQVNSKSGLRGSDRNGAYAGSKFGSIGLVQSFALELVRRKIKVNAVCPGNYLDGPLWSDPENGLFRQYLETGKVPGATTIEDVRKAYEGKVPMARGCRPEDVVRAILYCVEQEYETGQAIPVTGGQVMMG